MEPADRNDQDKGLIGRVYAAVKELGLDPTFIELAERIIQDHKPKLEHAFLFSNTKDNQLSVFKGAASLYHEGRAGSFLIIGSDDDTTGFPGYTRWANALEDVVGMGIHGRVMPVPLLPMMKSGRLNVNNKSESESLGAFAALKKIGALYAVAWNIQQLRAFMTAASEVISHGLELDVFNHLGSALPWEDVVYHSQGTEKGTREYFVKRELVKIAEYQAKGDIMPASDVISYMERRKIPP
ncbi:hypothetical protein HYU17_03995 [Candidatus Woesearchaeota archaeon]|nr:hypothetical protein [Candidatus Woesearchaeota archaeon]